MSTLIKTYLWFQIHFRNCLGKNFAECELKVSAALLLQHFEFRISTAYELRIAHEIITRPRDGAFLVVTPLERSMDTLQE